MSYDLWKATDPRDDLIAEQEERERTNAAKPPYPFCYTPAKCAGKGYCPRDIACND